MSLRTERRQLPPWFAPALLYLGATGGLYLGWRAFWFLTDDAFIAFRYVHNQVVGRGLVWNPAPFAPVEGYTSFLWVVCLALVERLFGVAPDRASNWLGLGLGLVSLAVVVKVLFAGFVPARWDKHRVVIGALVLMGILSNRTYLTWQSSGLETPLLNALLTGWLALLLTPSQSRQPRRLTWVCTLGALIGLTRPDGILFAAAGGGLVLLRACVERNWRLLWSALPLLLIPTHFAWRKQFYGEWLPNTYYAKYSGAWPESGLRYLGSFCIEYGLYVPLSLAIWVAIVHGRRALANRGARALVRGALAYLGSYGFVACASVALHLGSITFLIGGDHFEFRPYSYVVPWLWLGCLRLAARCFAGVAPALLFLTTSWLLSLPIPWLHWQQTRHLHSRQQTHYLHVRVAGLLPPPLSYLASIWDDWQRWLIGHYVCLRHQEHQAFLIHQLEFWATKQQGEQVPWSERNVLVATAVGIPGWVFPNVAVIDALGLNDFVVARTRGDEASSRLMAHERWPPKNYVPCFRPNVEGFRATYHLVPRILTDGDIRACERRFRAPLKD